MCFTNFTINKLIKIKRDVSLFFQLMDWTDESFQIRVLKNKKVQDYSLIEALLWSTKRCIKCLHTKLVDKKEKSWFILRVFRIHCSVDVDFFLLSLIPHVSHLREITCVYVPVFHCTDLTHVYMFVWLTHNDF